MDISELGISVTLGQIARYGAVLQRLLTETEFTDGGCWIWRGPTNANGYGMVAFRARPHRVHRLAFEIFVEPVGGPTCEHRLCWRLDHLEAITRSESIRRAAHGPTAHGNEWRRTHCRRGHELSEDNVSFIRSGGRVWRRCRECRRIATVNRKATHGH